MRSGGRRRKDCCVYGKAREKGDGVVSEMKTLGALASPARCGGRCFACF